MRFFIQNFFIQFQKRGVWNNGFHKEMASTFSNKLPHCHKCSKNVLPVERIQVNDVVFHEHCFVCQECNIRLSKNTYSSFEGSFYCMRDYYALLRKLKAPSESSGTNIKDSKGPSMLFINL